MTMPERTDKAFDTATIDAYLNGRLGEAEAEAFEARLFADDELAAELERSIELRAAALPTGSVRGRWLPLAAAAAVGVLAVGLVVVDFGPSPVEEPIMRSGESRLELTATGQGGAVVIDWPDVEGADTYRLDFYDADGRILVSSEVAQSELRVLADEIGEARIARVRAYDPLRELLADSGLRSIRDD